MKNIEKGSEGYFQRLITVLVTDRNGKLKLNQTAENLEEEIRYLLGEVVEIKIKRIKF